MSGADMTPREALMRLGASTAEAIAQVLEMFAPGSVERGDVSVMSEGQSPFNGIVAGSVAASVSYVDGVNGANIFVLTAAGVRSMAQAMGMPAPEGESDEPSELELSAVGEASNQMMSAAASAIGVVLGQEIEISPLTSASWTTSTPRPRCTDRRRTPRRPRSSSAASRAG